MGWLWTLNLIRLFNFYLGLMFLVSLYMRVSQYRAVLGIVRDVPSRWPRLFNLIRRYGHILLTWSTVTPALLALLLFLVNLLASQLIWPHVDLTIPRLLGMWLALPTVLTLAVAMVGVDVYCTFFVGEVDRQMMQKYFDQAEYWLRPWTGSVVHFFTLGHVNPRKMVDVEVQKALVDASKLINSSLWWVIAQVTLRIAFGLSLWFSFGWLRMFGG